jgi:hypothetical protein
VQHVRREDERIARKEVEWLPGGEVIRTPVAQALEPNVSFELSVPTSMAAGHDQEALLRFERKADVQGAQFHKELRLLVLIELSVLDVAVPVRRSHACDGIEEYLRAVKVEAIAEDLRKEAYQGVAREGIEEQESLSPEWRLKVAGGSESRTVD